jgi:hypothetical protein
VGGGIISEMTREDVTTHQATSEITQQQHSAEGVTTNIITKRPADDDYSNQPIHQQRRKREWLAAPNGIRHPRIGSDYQVSSLPSPSESISKVK